MAAPPARLLLAGAIALLAHTWPGDAFMPEKKTFKARREDVPLVRCEACAAMVTHTVDKVKELASSLPKKKKVTEAQILDIVENACDPEKDGGDWISRYDIAVQSDGRLHLLDMGGPGHCEATCKTVQKACEESLGDLDTDFAEKLFVEGDAATKDSMAEWLCFDEAQVCSTKNKPPKAPKDRKASKPWRAKTEQELEMDKMMRSMQGMPGMPGMQMFNREDLAASLDGYTDDEDDEGNEENEGNGDDGEDVAGARQDASMAATAMELVTGAGDTFAAAVASAANFAERAAEQARAWWDRTMGGGAEL